MNMFVEEEYTAEGDDSVPMERWGKDHWSTFAYLETRVVDGKGKIDNARMRCNARLHRHFAVVSPFGALQDGSKYPTRAKDGDIENHDDWSCLEDMVAAGLVRAFFQRTKYGEVFGDCRARVELTELGQKIAAQLRVYKAAGGNYHGFEVVA